MGVCVHVRERGREGERETPSEPGATWQLATDLLGVLVDGNVDPPGVQDVWRLPRSEEAGSVRTLGCEVEGIHVIVV